MYSLARWAAAHLQSNWNGFLHKGVKIACQHLKIKQSGDIRTNPKIAKVYNLGGRGMEQK